MVMLGSGRIITRWRKVLVPALNSWNCGTNITVSNNNLTATCTTGGTNGQEVLSKRGETSGKKYYAITIGGTAPGSGFGPGLATNGFTVGTIYLGVNSQSLCMFSNTGNVTINNATVATYFTLAANDLVEVAVDLGAKLFWIRKNSGNWNNNATGNPATGTFGLDISTMVGTAFYPAVNLKVLNEAFTLNNGLTPPVGFSYFSG